MRRPSQHPRLQRSISLFYRRVRHLVLPRRLRREFTLSRTRLRLRKLRLTISALKPPPSKSRSLTFKFKSRISRTNFSSRSSLKKRRASRLEKPLISSLKKLMKSSTFSSRRRRPISPRRRLRLPAKLRALRPRRLLWNQLSNLRLRLFPRQAPPSTPFPKLPLLLFPKSKN